MIEAKLGHPLGLHTRVAATAVDILSRQVSPHQLNHVYLHARGQRVLFTDLMAVTALRLQAGERVGLSLEDGDEHSLVPIARYLEHHVQNVGEDSTVDERIQQAMLTGQAILDNMSFGVLVVNTRNQISFVNEWIVERLGVPDPNRVLGKSSHDVVPESQLHLVLESGQALAPIKHMIGKTLVLTTSSPVFANGHLCGAMSTSQDISTLEQMAEELEMVRALKEQYDLVFKHVGDGICVTDMDGTIRLINPAYETLHGVHAEDLLGRSVFDVSPNGLRASVLRSGTPQRAKVRAKDHGVRFVADVSPISVEGQLRGTVSVTRSLSEVEQLLAQIQELQQETQYLKEELSRRERLGQAFEHMIGSSGIFRDCLAMANRAARTTTTVLLTGQSGTGKELVARAVHCASDRAQGPYIRVNCAGIPVPLIESELFGHERGAFTGAISMRKGKFELAQNGTIFLDEIGELPLEVQAKLLRVLQEREVERIGGRDPIPLNVRVICATNRDLESQLMAGQFREDLYYRINVLRIHLPPLRERKSDIRELAEFFIRELAFAMHKPTKGCTADVMAALESYRWPGNVRELRNVVERALNLCDGLWITTDHLPPALLAPVSGPTSDTRMVDARQEARESLLPLAEYERRIIARALELYPSFHAAGKALGISHKTVARKARSFGLVTMAQEGWVKVTRSGPFDPA